MVQSGRVAWDTDTDFCCFLKALILFLNFCFLGDLEVKDEGVWVPLLGYSIGEGDMFTEQMIPSLNCCTWLGP